MPLATLVGVSHQNANITFATALLTDETAETFQWFFRTLLSAVNNEAIGVVYTDQDNAIAAGLESEMPEAKHRLCAWHLEKNLKKNLAGQLETQSFNSIKNELILEARQRRLGGGGHYQYHGKDV